jgi:hypothetical protein
MNEKEDGPAKTRFSVIPAEAGMTIIGHFRVLTGLSRISTNCPMANAASESLA